MVNLLDDLSQLPNRNERTSVIISETDLQGNIVYANDAFCAISGFSRPELIGAPHNIIRNPAMPKEIFQMLWSTIQGGDVFRAIIKNQSKTGEHYWVNATIMPVFQGGKIIRYIGGRHHIPDEQLAQDLFKKQLLKLGLQGSH